MSHYTVAFAGNPNTGKSTLFNLLTGLRQHTGNWAGKTVTTAEGEFTHNQHVYRAVDLPGTYSLYSNSADEEAARDYIIFEQPDVTLVVLDATSLERNLNLALQVLEITGRAVVCINLIDEAKKLGISINLKAIAKQLGVPVVAISARNQIGIGELLDQLERVATGAFTGKPLRITYSDEIEQGIAELLPLVEQTLGSRYPARWIALRLLDGDSSLLSSLKAHMGRSTSPAHKEVTGHGVTACH
ncbi:MULTISPECIES: FeoB small GTPase domain-containing protein [unclassified Paenibacillus]|uniref:FeoB small GTPase domain-containing protein n=1 Tax=unclassified Paenibacillus TaxID=185978 RepID=UPI002405528D|nr:MULTISPECIES: FeoB small GTPase domain-containing protein [unclassified Paenibacillus]MDF9842147.1 Fe2+ transport system protein B [Paenibacillus sp. PastF-2]MDF9848599.1 Fe2+ transport system protein B [Paenibacillus sp. PastM-2]MDF9855168.1 Fe2+ transport system protein B [Paenibacillus sp. PastF-1]MDH6480438.1 Fe2+ transport system protein B [Paenibacillus sp. PastH-2]MDH6507866.1 Fe2+ transport system protein B [Paenibacillus sp. PastM-3]